MDISDALTRRDLCRNATLFAGAVIGQNISSSGNDRPTPLPPGLFYYRPERERHKPETRQVDVCIYGGTASGVMAATQLARLGRSILLLEQGGHIGGLTTGGLGYTDTGNKAAIGGMAREFYRRVGEKYGVAEEWNFEPHIAEQVLTEMAQAANVPIVFRQFLRGVKKEGNRLLALTTEDGLTVEARVFIDATYEGDLLAKAGVRFTVGREGNRAYGETLNGIQVRDKHQFEAPVSPYVVADDPGSGLLPGINPEPPPETGTGDKRVQAYNFRLCLTTDPDNRIPFVKPVGYDPAYYVLLARYLATGWNEVFRKFDRIRNNKVDMNNHGAVSSDFIGMSHAWPTAGYASRERLFRRHVVYQMGLMWFLANDLAVPADIRAKMSAWGLCKDEFTDTGGWSRQLYIREGRRMVSDYVMTEHDCRGKRTVEDSVGLASYGMDSHNCQRFVQDGRVWNEGDVQAGGLKPYPVSYRAITPRKAECANLLVPVCVSASHIAYGSIRMEPVFMILGQSAALAAHLALANSTTAVQDIPSTELQQVLLQANQVLA